MLGKQLPHDVQLPRVLGGHAELLTRIGHGVGHPQLLGQQHPEFGAAGRGDPTLVLQHLPGHIDLFGSDQRKDIVFAAILANQRGR
jgi:hypothetical protein